MKTTKLIPALFALAVLAFIIKSFLEQYEPAYDFPGWQHGASGYELALKEAEGTQRSLIVYFHTSWCGWCRKLDKNYLATSQGEAILSNIIKVEINPDKGNAEKALFKEFGLSGYPSFLVLSPKSPKRPVMLSPFVNGRELTVEEFLHQIKREMVSD